MMRVTPEVKEEDDAYDNLGDVLDLPEYITPDHSPGGILATSSPRMIAKWTTPARTLSEMREKALDLHWSRCIDFVDDSATGSFSSLLKVLKKC